jgi:hypothetical protein
VANQSGSCYEADVVKAPDWFFLLVGASFLRLRL